MGTTKTYFALIFCWIIPTLLLGNHDSLYTRTVLFKVTHPNTQKISYLFGTHHAFGKAFFDSLKPAHQLLASCDLLIKENLNIPGHLAEDIINNRTHQTKWKQYLSKEDLAFVNDIFASGKVDINKMTPTELYSFLTRYFKERVCVKKDTSVQYLSLDDYIGSQAEKINIQLLGLETTEEQIELINKDVEGMPARVHKKRLSQIIAHIRSNDSNNCGETDWYRRMDIDYKLDQPCQNALVLTDRNNRWIKIIAGYLTTNNCFIVVGLSHLMYECSLINQLQEIGYSVTPIKVN